MQTQSLAKTKLFQLNLSNIPRVLSFMHLQIPPFFIPEEAKSHKWQWKEPWHKSRFTLERELGWHRAGGVAGGEPTLPGLRGNYVSKLQPC